MRDMRTAIAGALFLVVGCSSTHSEPFTCALGELSGTWRTHYDETNGNCGALPDETSAVSTSGTGPPGCTINNKISTDKCRSDADFSCPTTDNRGSQHWTGVIMQTGAGHIDGSLSVQVNHQTLGACRSTYNVTMTKL